MSIICTVNRIEFLNISSQEEKMGVKASESKEVKIFGQIPPIEKMDASLSTLASCE